MSEQLEQNEAGNLLCRSVNESFSSYFVIHFSFANNEAHDVLCKIVSLVEKNIIA